MSKCLFYFMSILWHEWGYNYTNLCFCALSNHKVILSTRRKHQRPQPAAETTSSRLWPSELHASLANSALLIHELWYLVEYTCKTKTAHSLSAFFLTSLSDCRHLLLCTMSSFYIFLFLIFFVCDSEDFFPENGLELSVLSKLSWHQHKMDYFTWHNNVKDILTKGCCTCLNYCVQ